MVIVNRTIGLGIGTEAFAGATLWNVSIPDNPTSSVHQSRFAAAVGLLNGQYSLAFRDDKSLMQTRIASFVLIHTAPVIEDESHRLEILQATDGGPELANTFRDIEHGAFEVIFHLCVQTCNTAVQHGVASTALVNALAKPVPNQDPDFSVQMNCTTPLEYMVFCHHGDETKWNKTITLQGPTERQRLYSSDLGLMERIAAEMNFNLAGVGRDDFYMKDRGEEALEPSVYINGVTFPNLFYYGLYTVEKLTNATRRHSQIFNMYHNIASAISYR